MKRLHDAAKGGRCGQRDHLLLLMAYRHGLRVSELIDLRLNAIDLDTSRLFVRRKKGSLSTHQPTNCGPCGRGCGSSHSGRTPAHLTCS